MEEGFCCFLSDPPIPVRSGPSPTPMSQLLAAPQSELSSRWLRGDPSSYRYTAGTSYTRSDPSSTDSAVAVAATCLSSASTTAAKDAAACSDVVGGGAHAVEQERSRHAAEFAGTMQALQAIGVTPEVSFATDWEGWKQGKWPMRMHTSVDG